ncbi:stonin-2 isoform X1 [Scleropages formosus]|uniref:Stonin-2 n=2 Tax=Scleropages formosus TaxID=113540 RepID=A0A8C9RPS3_SCLFO|nr:stonin-2 isoform X1 [Scleropages formosus]XP_029114200.1 stonin-2 isoform X1 [Scleropages formosus]XP_029114201.1 stonin-2 isoform X1 [Scleropages formosus]XP_029114202.1 stonin-2 isoform X1 [Scleropages formosus]
MTSAAPTGRPGWVVFADEPCQTSVQQQSDGGSTQYNNLHSAASTGEVPPIPSGCGPEAADLSSQQNAWVQFEEKPWSPIPAPKPRAKGTRQSVCSSPSFWSAEPPSESSGTSQSEERGSLSDLPSLHPEELPSRTPSLTHSASSSIVHEDEGIDMDSLNLSLCEKQMNGQSDTHRRFASWVTFDDEEPGYRHSGSPPGFNPPVLGHSSTPDAGINLISLSPPGQARAVERPLLDLTPEGTNPAFTADGALEDSSSPQSRKNPFLDEGLSHILPSPINPFSAFFHTQETSGNGCSEKTGFSYSAPVTSADLAESQRKSVPLFAQVFNYMDDKDLSCNSPPEKGLEHLKSLWTTDSDKRASATLPDDSVDPEEPEGPVYQPAHMSPQDGWPMMLRIPEKKNIMSSRHWGPIFVKLTDSGRLQLFYEKGLEKPFKEFHLDGRHELSDHKLQSYDESGRVHTVSIDSVAYKEKRKIQPKVTVVHAPIREQLVKLGTVHYGDFLSFMHALRDTLMRLPVEPESPSSSPAYTEEEVVVDVRDEFHGIVSKGDNRILQHLVLTRVYALAFLTGSPTCRIGFNDIQVKGNEVVSLHDIIPNTTTRWIKLRDRRLHGCVDENEFADTRAVAFTPPVGRRFELLRFRSVFVEKSLPFTLRTVASVRGAEVELQSWLAMSSGFSSNRDPLALIPCENVMIRYPIPLIWAKNFRRESATGEKSLKARFNKGASFGSSSTSGLEPAMRVTLGTAKYEHAFRAVVWRISALPDKNSALGHPHTFFCRLELGSDWEVPPKFQRYLDVEFDMPAASASKTTVRSLSVGDRTDVKKWINYRSHYFYQVEMEQKSDCALDDLDAGKPGECSLQ